MQLNSRIATVLNYDICYDPNSNTYTVRDGETGIEFEDLFASAGEAALFARDLIETERLESSLEAVESLYNGL